MFYGMLDVVMFFIDFTWFQIKSNANKTKSSWIHSLQWNELLFQTLVRHLTASQSCVLRKLIVVWGCLHSNAADSLHMFFVGARPGRLHDRLPKAGTLNPVYDFPGEVNNWDFWDILVFEVWERERGMVGAGKQLFLQTQSTNCLFCNVLAPVLCHPPTSQNSQVLG